MCAAGMLQRRSDSTDQWALRDASCDLEIGFLGMCQRAEIIGLCIWVGQAKVEYTFLRYGICSIGSLQFEAFNGGAQPAFEFMPTMRASGR